MRITINKITVILGFAALILLSLGLFITYRRWNFDDAYISYRIIHNIITGHGWVYNIGQSHNPSTSVLNILLIAALAYPTNNIILSAHLLDTAVIFAAAFFVYMIFRRRFPAGLCLFTAYFLLFKLGTNRTWGIETNMFICVLFAFVFFEQKRINSWPIAGLLILVRPDGILLSGFKWLKELIVKKSLSLKGLLIVAVILMPWLIFSFLKFGRFFPDTFNQKLWQGASGYWGTGLIYLEGLLKHYNSLTLAEKMLFIISGAAVPLVLFRRSPLIYVALFAICQQAAYILLNVPGYHWYFSILDAAAYLLSAYAICEGLVLLKNQWFKFIRNQKKIETLTGLSKASFLLLMLALIVHSVIYILTGVEDPKLDPRDISYANLIKVIDARYDKGDLATIETGTIGFYTDRDIVDIAGLVSRQGQFITPERMDDFYADPPEFILLHAPVWYKEGAVYSDYRFAVFYKEVMYFESYYPMQLFQRRRGDLSELLKQIDAVYPSFKAGRFSLPDIVPLQYGAVRVEYINGDIIEKVQTVFKANGPLLHLEGWALHVRSKSAPPELFALLVSDSNIYSIRGERTRRRDIARRLNDKSFLMSGFSFKGLIKSLPKGTYKILIVQKVRDDYYYSEIPNQLKIP